MSFALLFLILLSPLVAPASGRPGWTSATPRADGVYKYYVGRALDEASERDGWRVAKDQAQEAAVRENFGVETSIAASSYETSKEVTIDKRVSEAFPKVRLLDFEQIGSFTEERGERFSVWLIYRYPIKQAEAERERLKSAAPPPVQAFNAVGSPEMAYSTSVEVTSEPMGIPVFIDGERWGVTPLRVQGVLATGVHKIKLSHATHQDVESQMVLVKGFTKKIHQRMRPAVGYLRIEVEPGDAQISIDGVPRNGASVSPLVVRVGAPKNIEVKKDGYETQIQIVELKKDQIRLVNFSLNAIEQKTKAPVPEKKPSEEPFELEPSAPTETEEQSNDFRKAGLLGLYFGFSAPSAPKPYGLSTAQFGFSLEQRFLYLFGLRAGASYDFAIADTETSKNTSEMALTGWGAFVGLPIYLTLTDSGLYLMPEVGVIRHRRIKEQTDFTATPEYLDMRATRTGGRLGYMSQPSHIDMWVGLHEYDWREWGKVQVVSGGIAYVW